VKPKEEAKNTYNDALTAGNTAVVAERKKTGKEEIMTLIIGNLLPGQTAVIKIQMIT
jgi:hypothetical protein